MTAMMSSYGRAAPLRLNAELCRACKRCLARDVCKIKAIVRPDRDDAPFIDLNRCYDCRVCIPACPFGAITVE
jgi:Fe-S-cluster-containing hydrogenase component 2